MSLTPTWSRIEDIPSDWVEMCREDLHAIRDEWVQERALLKDPEKVRQFQDRLATLWAIETGIIERLYTVDRGVTIALADVGLGALGRFHTEGALTRDAVALIKDQRAALDMVMDVVGGLRDLTSSYIKELHHQLTLSQEYCEAVDAQGNRFNTELKKGEWKTLPNNPTRPDGVVHEYCPPEFVQDEIDQLLRWHENHQEARVCPEVQGAWLHHRFTEIHPFQDGNGRVARALTAAALMKADYLTLVVRDQEHKGRYLEALESADGGDLKPLVDLFCDIEIVDLREAISFVRSLRGETLLRVAESAAARARRRQELEETRAQELTEPMVEATYVRLQEVAAELERQFSDQGVRLAAWAYKDDPGSEDYWWWQIVEAAQHHGYFADRYRFRRWARLRLRLPELERTQTHLVFSFHAVGRAADLRTVSAFLTTSTEPDDKGSVTDSDNRWGFEIGSEHSFQYRTSTSGADAMVVRFKNWLEGAIQFSLDAWGERL